nr:DUF2207 domain-containing protein [Kineosphaera limosa]
MPSVCPVGLRSRLERCGLRASRGRPGGAAPVARSTACEGLGEDRASPTRPTEEGQLPMLTVICMVLCVALVAGAWPLAGQWRDRHASRIYEGLTPGLTPPVGAEQPTRPITERELLATNYAVAFNPPEGVQPREVGLLLDRQTGPRDLAASIIALVVNGYLTMRKDDEGNDWIVTVNRDPQRPPHAPEPDSLWLLDYFDFGDGQPVSLSAAKPGLRDAFARLESEVLSSAVEKQYIDLDPRGRKAPTGGLTFGAVFAALIAGFLGLAGNPLAWVAAGGAGALAITAGRVRGPMGRPAEGTAAYFRTMGFKRYIDTAEANQIKVEDAAGIFSRYLPWAIAFNAADHWTGVFKDVARGVDEDIAALWAPDLIWMALWMDIASGGALFAGLGEALTDLTDGIGDLTGDVFGDGGMGDGGFGDGGDAGDAGGGGDAGGDGGWFGGGGDGDGGGFFGDFDF